MSNLEKVKVLTAQLYYAVEKNRGKTTLTQKDIDTLLGLIAECEIAKLGEKE